MKTIGFTFLALIFVGNIHAQELFSGVVTYRMSMGGASATTYTTYYRAGDQLTDMPQSKMKTLYLAKEKTMYTVMGMMGKPIVSSRSFDPDTMEVPLFDVADGIEVVAGHRCIRRVEVYNLMGQMVKKEDVNGVAYEMNVSDLETGMYLVKILTPSGSVSRKLVVTR